MQCTANRLARDKCYYSVTKRCARIVSCCCYCCYLSVWKNLEISFIDRLFRFDKIFQIFGRKRSVRYTSILGKLSLGRDSPRKEKKNLEIWQKKRRSTRYTRRVYTSPWGEISRVFFILIVARREPDALRIVATRRAAVRSHATCSLGGASRWCANTSDLVLFDFASPYQFFCGSRSNTTDRFLSSAVKETSDRPRNR